MRVFMCFMCLSIESLAPLNQDHPDPLLLLYVNGTEGKEGDRSGLPGALERAWVRFRTIKAKSGAATPRAWPMHDEGQTVGVTG